jgi:hypothetical protein
MFDGAEAEPFELGEHIVTNSGKMIILDQMLKRLKADGHKVLLFSQFTNFLDIIQVFICTLFFFGKIGKGFHYEVTCSCNKCLPHFFFVAQNSQIISFPSLVVLTRIFWISEATSTNG